MKTKTAPKTRKKQRKQWKTEGKRDKVEWSGVDWTEARQGRLDRSGADFGG
jgi:hypothetical protein